MSGNDAKSPEVTVIEVPDIPELKDTVWKEDILSDVGDKQRVLIHFNDGEEIRSCSGDWKPENVL